jgi:hypothetical protein
VVDFSYFSYSIKEKQKNMITLPTEILLYSNPFNLLFRIVGNEGEKNCYINLFKKFPKDRLEVFFQGESFSTKKEVVDNLERILREFLKEINIAVFLTFISRYAKKQIKRIAVKQNLS